MDNLLTLKDLYTESLVRETIEKTKNFALTWTHLGGNQFSTSYVQNIDDTNISWLFYVTKTQIGTVSFQYTLDIKKNGITYITDQEGPLPYTDRESAVKELYEIVEIIVLQLDARIKETIYSVQGQTP